MKLAYQAAGVVHEMQHWQLRVMQEHGAERILLARPLYGHHGIERVQAQNERQKMNDHEIDAELVERLFYSSTKKTLTGMVTS